MKTLKCCFLFITVILMGFPTAKAQVFIDIESGLVFGGYNDVRIPGDGGTRFSLTDDLKSENEWFYRLRGGFTFNKRHTISLLYAPLTVKSDGSIDRPIEFSGTTFPSNTPLNGTYKFNSYRLTYRYDFVHKTKTEFGLGVTAKIRDAKIDLSSQGLAAEKENFGVVPLINFRLALNGEKLGFLLEGDALAAPQGRAEDVLAALTFKLSDKITWKLGYRILEGGADNDEVYTFAMFHYASTGFIIDL